MDASVTDPKSRKSVEPFWKPNLKNNLISASGSGQNDYFKTAMMKETGRQSNGGRTEESRGYSPLITAPSKTVRKNGELDNQRCANKQTNGGDSYRGLLKNEFNKYSMKLLISEYAPPPANGMPSPLKGKLGGTAGDQNKGRQESGRKEEKNEQQAVESKKDTNQKDGYSLAKLQSIVDRLPLDPRVKFGKREANGGQKAPHQVAQQVIKSEGQPTQHLNNMESRPSHSGQVKPTQKEQTSPLQNSPFRKTDSQVPSQSNHTAFHDNRGFKDGLNAQAVRTMH